MRIILIHDEHSPRVTGVLSLLGEVFVLPNMGTLEQYLLSDAPCNLVAVALDGAAGMNCCIMAKRRREHVPILWVTEQPQFEPQSRRIPVDAFLVRPVTEQEIFQIAQTLLQSR